MPDNPAAAATKDRFRPFRNRLLLLLSGLVAVTGIALIVISLFTHGNVHDVLVGVGAAIFATGPITVMVWWVTDDMYRGALTVTLRDVVSAELETASRALSSDIRESGAAIGRNLRQSSSVARDCQRLGVLQVHVTRADALNNFSLRIHEEIERAEHGQPALLWFVCTSLRGFLDLETNKFNPQALIRAAATHENLDLRFLMADPEYLATRSPDTQDSQDLLYRSYAAITRLQRDYGVPAGRIRLYAFRPTVFAITTSRHMLLNPYPHEEQGSRCMSIVVAKTNPDYTGGNSRDIYSQYLESHFTRTWTAATTRGVDEPPPLVSRISLSGDATETNALLLKEITERAPMDADLIEYSGDTVRPLLEHLATAGTRVRLLLKHPDSVGSAQRDKILSTYRYIKEYQFRSNPDAIQVRFYKVPATLRGRRLDTRLLNVGWYTPDIATGGRMSEWEVIGHLNPTITSYLQTNEGYALNLMFSRTFDGMWGSAEDSAVVDTRLANANKANTDPDYPTAASQPG
jgi:hypothetical protein